MKVDDTEHPLLEKDPKLGLWRSSDQRPDKHQGWDMDADETSHPLPHAFPSFAQCCDQEGFLLGPC